MRVHMTVWLIDYLAACDEFVESKAVVAPNKIIDLSKIRIGHYQCSSLMQLRLCDVAVSQKLYSQTED